MNHFINDLRYAWRQLLKAPGFALTAVLVLALGVGANAAMFTVLDAVLLRQLPYADANRLIVPTMFYKQGEPIYGAMYPDIAEWQKRAHTLSGIAYVTSDSQFMEVAHSGESVSNVQSSANLFSVLGVQPEIGRTYSLAEQSPGHEHVVVLSDALWTKLFHRNPNVLGQTIKLDGDSYTVIGVMPKGFSYPFSGGQTEATDSQVWAPLPLKPDVMTRVGSPSFYSLIARLKPGASMNAAQTELNHLQQAIAKEYPANYQYPIPTSVQTQSYRSQLTRQYRPSLLVLEAACLMLWLIACANVAGLLLVRASARQRQIAVRAALGAGRSRLVWQSLSESLLISVVASAVGIVLAAVALRVFRHALLQRIDIVRDIHLNWPVVFALALFAVLTAAVCGILPALIVSRIPALQTLQQGTTQMSAGRRQKRLREGLIVFEIALSLTLLVACGLMLRTLYDMRHEPLGIRTDHIVTANFDIPSYEYRNANVVAQLYQPMLERTRHLPDVQAASLSTTVPLDEGFFVQLTMYGKKKPTDPRNASVNAQLGATTPDMQRVFGFRMLQGRFFNAQDTVTSQPVIVVNQAFAKAYWRDGPVLGKPFTNWRTGKKSPRAVVAGVMDDLPQRSLADQRGPQVLICVCQLEPEDTFYDVTASHHMQLAVRTKDNPEVVIPEIRTLLSQLAPQLRGIKTETMDQVVEDSMGDQNLAAHLLELFGGTALIITLAGLYGSLLYMVSLRRREMAVRLAVGAQRADILRLVLSRAAILLLMGLVAGIAISYATGRYLQSYLYKVHPGDQTTIVLACLLFLSCGLLAAYLPARRAAMTEPIEILREE